MKSISCILHKLVHDLLSCQAASFDTFFIIITINAQVQRMVVAHTRSELKKIQSYQLQQQTIYLKTVSIQNYLQLTEIKNEYFIQKGSSNPDCQDYTYNVRRSREGRQVVK